MIANILFALFLTVISPFVLLALPYAFIAGLICDETANTYIDYWKALYKAYRDIIMQTHRLKEEEESSKEQL